MTEESHIKSQRVRKVPLYLSSKKNSGGQREEGHEVLKRTWWTTPCPSSCCPPEFFFAGQVGGIILNLSYSLTFYVGPFRHAQKLWGGGVGLGWWPLRF